MIGEIDLWHRLSEAISAEQARRGDGVVSGQIETFDRYRFETGFIQGLQWVLDRAEEIVKASQPPTETEQQEES